MAVIEKTRIDIKLIEEKKRLFKKAAEYCGKTLTDFLISSAEEKAIEVVREHEQLLNSQRDREAFFHALMTPPEPSKKLRASAAKFLATLDE